ncbi:MAG: choice-of-anchor D domain-containing protein [Phycisphaerae bacterium]|nr:choice-of-anchor D domain-containing protein [Phycisphaerae bacterium]
MLFRQSREVRKRKKVRSRKSTGNKFVLEQLDKRVLLSVSTDFIDAAEIVADDFGMATSQEAAFDSAEQVLYLDFDGAIVYNNYPTDYDLHRNYVYVPPFTLEGLGFSGQEANAINNVMQFVQEDYAAYNITVTQEKPTEGGFSTIYIGGTGGYAPGSVIGRATYDVGNSSDTNYGFVYSEVMVMFAEASNDDVDVFSEYLANVITHEAAHTFGLAHVNDTSAIMNPFVPIDPLTLSFRSDSEALLGINLGYKSIGGDDYSVVESVGVNEVISGLLERRADTDSFDFTADARGEMVVDLDTTVYGNLDSVLSVYDGSGNLITSNDDYNGQDDSKLVFNVSQGANYTVVVSSSGGNSSGTYSLTFDGPDGGGGEVDPALISISDSVGVADDLAMDFGTLTVGDNLIKTFTISNDGGENLVINSVITAGEFTVVPADGSSGVITLANGQSKNFNVTYAPGNAGIDNNSVVINSNSGGVNTATTIDLDGIGQLAPSLIAVSDSVGAADDLAMDFGTLTLGQSLVKTITVSNNGGTDLDITPAIKQVNYPAFAYCTFS